MILTSIFIDRVIKEEEELKLKMLKLYSFLKSNDVWINLDDTDRVFLEKQLKAMENYLFYLQRRIDKITNY